MYNNLKEFIDKYTSFKEKYEKSETFERTALCDIMEKNMSDKSYPKDLRENESYHIKKKRKKSSQVVGFHNYTLFYHEFFHHMRSKQLNIFELGLGSNNPSIVGWMGKNARPGASIYGWSEYFKNSMIYGGDIDEKSLFDDVENNISTYKMDQKSKSDVTNVFKKIGKEFDIIIDDGRHWPDYNLAFFKNSYKYLKKGGLFIIEDLYLSDHSRGNFMKMHHDNLSYAKTKSRYADILRMKSKYGPKDEKDRDTSNNLMVILK